MKGYPARVVHELRDVFAAVATLCLLSQPVLAAPPGTPDPGDDTSQVGKRANEIHHQSKYLGDVVVPPGVFHPIEAETCVLPFMEENAKLFPGKRVLEIGSGTGIISSYAAKLGAAQVVSTDISDKAVAATKRNAERLGFGEKVEARLVPASDISAYSVLKPGERFDIIISNPPYSLDLEATKNDAVTDTGDLGFSIIRGLNERLNPDGKAILFYGSLFYHLTMVKFAQYSGFEARSHPSQGLTTWESEALFNSYLQRLLAREKVDPGAFRFTDRDPGLIGFADPMSPRIPPLFPGNSKKPYRGMIVIERKPAAGAKP